MAEPIAIEIEMEGQEESTSETEQLISAIQELKQAITEMGNAESVAKTKTDQLTVAQNNSKRAADAAAASQTAQALAALQMTQKVQGAIGAVQGLVSALGSDNQTAGLVASTLGASVQLGTLGATFGPIGAAIGALLPIIMALTAEQEELEDQTRETITAQEEQARRLSEISRQVRDARESALVAGDSEAIFGVSPDQLRDFLTLNRQYLAQSEGILNSTTRLTAEARQFHETRVAGSRAAIENLELEIERQGELGRLLEQDRIRQAELARLRAAAERHRDMEAADNEAALQSLRDQINAAAIYAETTDERAEAERVLAEAWSLSGTRQDDAITRVRSALISLLEVTRELTEAENERGAAIEQTSHTSVTNYEKEKAAAADAAREQEAHREYSQGQAERYLEQRAENVRQQSELAADLNNQLIGGLTDAFTAMAEGNQTAEESSKLVLALFLKMISQQASLLAGMEFGKAIADAASQNWGGFAGHLAAGILFTGVAVATGVGANVLQGDVSKSQAARQDAEKPEKPESSGNQKGGDTIINWNMPAGIIVADQAQMGRQIEQLRRAAQRRGMI